MDDLDRIKHELLRFDNSVMEVYSNYRDTLSMIDETSNEGSVILNNNGQHQFNNIVHSSSQIMP